MGTSSKTRVRLLLGTSALFALATAALAQTEPATTQVAAAEPVNPNVQVAGVQPDNPNTVNRPAVETVIVTARRREENLQRVPGAISVVGGDLLDNTFTVNPQSLAQLVPSLYYNSANP